MYILNDFMYIVKFGIVISTVSGVILLLLTTVENISKQYPTIDACKTFFKLKLNSHVPHWKEDFSDSLSLALKKTNFTNDSVEINRILHSLCNNEIFKSGKYEYISHLNIFNGTSIIVLLCFLYMSVLIGGKLSTRDSKTLLYAKIMTCFDILTVFALLEGSEVFVWISLLIELTALCIIHHRKGGVEASVIMFLYYNATVAWFSFIYYAITRSWLLDMSSNCILFAGYGSKGGLIFASLLSDREAGALAGFIGASSVTFSGVFLIDNINIYKVLGYESMIGIVVCVCMLTCGLDVSGFAYGSYIGILCISSTFVFIVCNGVVPLELLQIYVSQWHSIHLILVILGIVSVTHMAINNGAKPKNASVIVKV